MTVISLNRSQDSKQLELNWAKKSAEDRVNKTIGRMREAFVSWLPGQEMIYLSKELEAQRYLAIQPAALTGFPFLAAEVGITADTAEEVAVIWLDKAQEWKAAGASLEEMRHAALLDIREATSLQQVNDIMTAFESMTES
jgi:hypothetical protein